MVRKLGRSDAAGNPPSADPRPLLAHLAGFGRALAAAGVATDPAKAIDLARSLAWIDVGNSADFRAAARAIYVSHHADLDIFDRVFEAYWGLCPPVPLDARAVRPDHGAAASDGGAPGDVLDVLGDASDEQAEEDGKPRRTGASLDERLLIKNLGELSEPEIEHARVIVTELVAALASLRARRTVAAARGPRLDLRRSMRRNLLRGRDGVELVYRRHRIQRTKLLVLCDVSGSMERYSRFLIQFIYGLRRVLPDIDVGVFATRMTVITSLLDDRDAGASLRRVAQSARDWGGGTDIGGCLGAFNRRFARALVRRRTVVVILSDGWDRGDATVLHDELERLRRRAHKLIWLNPLLGHGGYEPLCRGMRTALPFMDYFLPAHNLASLKGLATTLRAVWR